jgi:E3 ubiquitin-protein ligase HUWE1
LEEARILFGSAAVEQGLRVLIGVIARLIGPAIEADKQAQADRKEQEEKLKQAQEEQRKLEQKAREEAEEAERKAKEEAEEAERQRQAELAAQAPATEETTEAQPMEGVESTAEGQATTENAEQPAEPAERVVIQFRGNPLDITDLGIDPGFLDALPEELQEEVITAAIAERRSQAQATGTEAAGIDEDFLNALPDDIRDEIVQEERANRRRREREEQRRQASSQVPPTARPVSTETDPLAALQSLSERMQVLDNSISDLRDDLLTVPSRAPPGSRLFQTVTHVGGPAVVVNAPKPVRRTIIQMLDKAGIATLLRLMFISQQESLKQTLYSVLQNVSENRHNRAEVITTLLHVLLDGSMDVTAVERSFAQLSLRAKQPKDKDPKTPTLSRKNTAGSLVLAGKGAPAVLGITDVSPLTVVQQCLGTLIYLSKVNLHVASFFLTEHEGSAPGLKKSLSRKGKGKINSADYQATKFALNSLLLLLDRKLIMESSTVMESLSDLLSRVTAPLQTFERRAREAEEAEKRKKEEEEKKTKEEAEKKAGEGGGEAQQGEKKDDDAEKMDVEPAEGVASDEAKEGEVKREEGAEAAKTEEKKKVKPFQPPVVPESHLKLVINIFVARECSAKTFRETLSTVKNLSCIPGAKPVFGKELVRRAQELAEVILVDLESLLPQIQNASSSTELQGVALQKFSPSGSDQNKLLRVLHALDHLFDPKNSKKDEANKDDADKTKEPDTEKQDLLATLYHSDKFAPMWEKLSACLSAIRQREGMLNVATILLPLIEALMVVCNATNVKNETSKRRVRESSVTPDPESRLDQLFFKFTEDHRKILNELVRANPKLMSGTFKILADNPKVLEFDNKRNYFARSLHPPRMLQPRQNYPTLQLSVRRSDVFLDSFKSLYYKSGDEVKYGKLSIRFHGEEGVDAGGVSREWFQVLSRQMFDPNYALFIPVSSDRTTFHPNHLSWVNGEHLMFFKFIGRIIGKALYENRVLDCHFSRAVYKRILSKSVSVKDMESLDPEYYKSLVWMLENDITDIIAETFSVDKDTFGVVETVDLIPNGRNIAVTEENKQEYVRLMVEHKLVDSVKDQLDEFLKGFHEIIPAELISIFNEQELELLISGLPEVDVDDWKANTEYHNYTASSPQIQWFWRALRSFDKEEKAKLLQFVTGTSKVPLNGFKELEGMNGFSRFNIHRDYGSKERLPSSHTCFNRKLPYPMMCWAGD